MNQTYNSMGEQTRQKLIQAATTIFIEQGFRAARVQDIAKLAGVRISAINYHFENKEGLYLAVLRQHAEQAIVLRPLFTDPNLPLESQFRFLIHSLLLRMLDQQHGSQIAPLMLREMVNPTAALDDMFERLQYPQLQLILTLLKQILPDASQERLLRCTLSIISQCFVYVLARPVIERIDATLLNRENWLAEIEDHVVRFSWAGLQAFRGEESA